MSDMDEDKPKVTITLRTIVTGPEAGSIIGRGGEVVNSIRDESGAKIRIEGSSPQERIITVDGPTDSIFKAYTLICKTLEERELRDSRESGGRRDRESSREREGDREDLDLHLNLLIPSSQCGAIIGKEGTKIKEIRETTGASIHVSCEPLPGSSERYVKVAGNREEVTQCIYHICCALLESPPKGEPRLYRPDTGFQNEVRGPRMRLGDRDSRYREDDRRWGNGEMSSYYDSGRRDEGRRSPPGGFGGHSGAGGFSPFDAIADFARRNTGGRRRDDSRDRELRHEMSVPNDVVGAVIGKRGAKINEIRQISGATINIMETGQRKRERSPDPGALDRERIIEISGPTEAVALAKSLINMAMDLGRAGYNEEVRGGGSSSGMRDEGGRRERDDRRGGNRTRSRSRDRGYGGGDRHRQDRRDKFAPY